MRQWYRHILNLWYRRRYRTVMHVIEVMYENQGQFFSNIIFDRLYP